MRRILIAEDEFLVRLGLKTTIDWKSHGYVIVGEASNGKEALQMFDATNPDILITDIKMPMMDGLELLAEAKRRKPEIQGIILSNYDDFEYARQAMRYGANQYLLKSEISEECILRALKALPADSTPAPAQETANESAQERYLRRHVHSRISFDSLQVRNPQNQDTLFPAPCYLAFRGDGDVDWNEELDEDTVIKNIESLLGATFEGMVFCCSIVRQRLLLSAVCPIRPEVAAELQKWRKKVDILIRNAKLYFDTELHIGVSRAACQRPLSELFSQAETARLHCFFTGASFAFFGDFEPPTAKTELQVNTKKIQEYAASGSHEEMAQYIGQLFEEIQKQKNYNALRTVFVDFLSVAKSIHSEKRSGSAGTDQPFRFYYNSLDTMSSLQNARGYVLDVYQTLLDALGSDEELSSLTIRRCKQYVDEHYAENLSLDMVARAVGMSKSYLSMMFKQEVGINFSTYLTSYRIEQAKQLLAISYLKIYEIAEMVGFSTPYYFSKVFKDQTGMSCREYKDTQ